MKRRLPCAARVLVATVVGLLWLPVESAQAKRSKELHRAAVECDVAAFAEFMNKGDAEYVLREQARMTAHESKLDAAYQLARSKLGEGVSRVPGGIRFQLNPEDDRWARVFGSEQWSAIASHPDGTAQVTVSFTWEWSGECRDIYRFYACLSDRSFCKEGSATEDSTLRIERGDFGRRTWGLALKPITLREAESRDALRTVLAAGVERLQSQLEGNLPKSYDDAVLQIFVHHMRWMQDAQSNLLR